MADPIEVAAQALYTNTTPVPNRWNDLYPEARIGYRSDARFAIAAWLEAVGVRTVPGHARVGFRNIREFADAVRAVEQGSLQSQSSHVD